MLTALQVDKQEQELDDAYDALEKELRRVPCKNWHKVLPGHCLNALPFAFSKFFGAPRCKCNIGNLQDIGHLNSEYALRDHPKL